MGVYKLGREPSSKSADRSSWLDLGLLASRTVRKQVSVV